MGKRGSNLFKRTDAKRAIQSALDAGIAPSMVEIITQDGTTFRIYGDKAAPTPDGEVMSSAEWDREIEKLKTKKGS
jgi:hypothetical protein